MLGNMLESTNFKQKVNNLRNRGKKENDQAKKAL